MSSLIPPELRKLRSSGSPITISPPERACRIASIPSRSAVPGAIISSAFISPGSALTSESNSSPVRSATTFDSRVFTVCLALAGGAWKASCNGLGAGSGPRRQRQRERLRQRLRLACPLAAARRGDHLATAVLGRLGQAALGVAHPAKLAGQPQLAEAGARCGGERQPAAGAGHGQRDGHVAARLLHA